MMKVPMTVQGAERLKAELHRLKTVERPAVIQALADARSQGDLSENADYDAAKERQKRYDVIQTELERDMPYIPILTGGTTSEYHASKFEGWPTEYNLYAVPAVWSRPDQAQIYKALKPAG